MRTGIVALAVGAVIGGRAVHQGADVRLVQLRADSTIDGVRCGPTGRASAGVYPNGRLESCPVAHDTTIAGNILPRLTWIYLSPSGELAHGWLDHNTTLNGHACRGTGYKGWSVQFHPGGRLKSCFLVDVEVIDGVPCQRGTFWNELSGSTSVLLREDGTLASCKAARTFQRGGNTVRGGERVRVP